jgi:hypothetical protein
MVCLLSEVSASRKIHQTYLFLQIILQKKLYTNLFVLSVLYVLFVPSVKASCIFNSYNQCTGTCSCPAGYCGGCSCVVIDDYCISYSNCHSCPTSTSAPRPTSGASPTVTPGSCTCKNEKCVGNLTHCRYAAGTCNNNCSDPTKNVEIKEYCEDVSLSNPCGTKSCAGYSASCVTNANCNKNAPGCGATPVSADCNYNAPGCNICGYARTEAIYCNGVHCGDTCAPNALCSNSPWCSGGGGGNPTNTPTPTAFLRVRLLNPALSPVAFSDVTLCKVRCDTAPCSAVSCQTGVSLADFPGSIPADRGGAIRDGPESPCYGPPSTVYRPPSDRLESPPYCRLRSAVCGLFIVSSCLRGEKRINHQDTKSQS